MRNYILKRFKIIYNVALFLIITPLLASAEMEIRHIAAPQKIAYPDVGRELYPSLIVVGPQFEKVAARPNMLIEQVGNKIVAINPFPEYSPLGGYDYVQKINNLLIDSKEFAELRKNSPIALIGDGPAVLLGAYNLHKGGYKDISIIAGADFGLTDKAASRLWLVPAEDHEFYKQIAQNQHADFKELAYSVPVYFETGEDSLVAQYVKAKTIKPGKDVLLNFGNGTKRHMLEYNDFLLVDTLAMKTGLLEYAKNNNIKIISQERLQSWKDIDAKYLINYGSYYDSRIKIPNHQDVNTSTKQLGLTRFPERSEKKYGGHVADYDLASKQLAKVQRPDHLIMIKPPRSVKVDYVGIMPFYGGAAYIQGVKVKREGWVEGLPALKNDADTLLDLEMEAVYDSKIQEHAERFYGRRFD